MDQCEKLLDWYHRNRRELPWRNTGDPYKIWLSEVMLQQTRVEQGLGYYLRFLEAFPDVHALAAAPQDEVLKLWQGLGYYSRAHNLHETAKRISRDYNGKFPGDYSGLISLKGIGPYSAAAIASIAFNQAVPVIDGNVMRVISRWFAIEEPVNSGPGKKAVQHILEELIDRKHPGKFNQALMEFGALHCKPQNPDCGGCIFKAQCMAFQQKKVDVLPVKMKKKLQTTRFFCYLYIRQETASGYHTFLQKRSAQDIWKGLYEFPLIESKTGSDPDQIIQTTDWKNLFGKTGIHINKVYPQVKHHLTHQLIKAMFIEIEVDPAGQFPWLIRIPEHELGSYPVPRLIDRFIHARLQGLPSRTSN
ncbi:MAG: A/G-specific adenine glycosylase [Bacteroidota bacterium]